MVFRPTRFVHVISKCLLVREPNIIAAVQFCCHAESLQFGGQSRLQEFCGCRPSPRAFAEDGMANATQCRLVLLMPPWDNVEEML